LYIDGLGSRRNASDKHPCGENLQILKLLKCGSPEKETRDSAFFSILWASVQGNDIVLKNIVPDLNSCFLLVVVILNYL